jgi:hypothetical protein
VQENDIADAPRVFHNASVRRQTRDTRAERTGIRITGADRKAHRGFRRHAGRRADLGTIFWLAAFSR